jgi:hypothetical protein
MEVPDAITEHYNILLNEDTRLLTRIHAIEALKIHLRAFQGELVQEARQREGATWDEIGAYLGGLSKQAAQQRFAWAKVE